MHSNRLLNAKRGERIIQLARVPRYLHASVGDSFSEYAEQQIHSKFKLEQVRTSCQPPLSCTVLYSWASWTSEPAMPTVSFCLCLLLPAL